MASMTLREKISQLFIVSLENSVTPFDKSGFEKARFWTEEFQAGGFILFKNGPLEQAAFVHDLQALAPVRLFIAQDMEWGASMRIPGSTDFPRAMAVAASGDPGAAYEVGRITAEEARAVGVNFILAPVADVNTAASNPVIAVRSFGDSPSRVSDFVNAFIAGVVDRGLIATAKHFPGHGATNTDSHRQLPVLDASRLRSDSLDMYPFRKAIEAGVPAIMTAHVAFPDSGTTELVPATLSRQLVTGLLREQMGFTGLVITDALNMRGLPADMSGNEIAIRAIEAGADLLLMPPDPESSALSILNAVKTGRINRQRIDDSVRRILEAKARLRLTDSQLTSVGAVRSVLTLPEHRATAARIARESVVVLENRSVLPVLPSESVLLVSLIDPGNEDKAHSLEARLRSEFRGNVGLSILSTGEWKSGMGMVLRRTRQYSTIVLADLSSEYHPRPRTLRQISNRLQRTGKPVILAGMGSPFSLGALESNPDGLIVSFGAPESSLTAVAQVITGTAGTCGQLPVSVSESFSRGGGLCLSQSFPRKGYPGEIGMSDSTLRKLSNVMYEAIADSAFPGAAVAVGSSTTLAEIRGFGRFEYESDRRVGPASVFDMASLTKTIATTTAIMQLYEAEKLDLDDPVAKYVPEFGVNGKDIVTIRDLLTHTGGLIPFRRFYAEKGATRASVLHQIYSDSLDYFPGSRFRYSDFGPIVLAIVIERISGEQFGSYAKDHIFKPLGMLNTTFRRATKRPDPSIVPTEQDDYFRHTLVQGSVHDETAWILGGTAGHAGLFSTVEDLSRFAGMLLSGGRVGERQFLKPETIRLFTTVADPSISSRALGWDTKSMSGYSSFGSHFGPLSFGHTGFTGTSLWIDPDQNVFVILLTNRVYPTRDNSRHRVIRQRVADGVFEALEQ